MSQLQTVGEAVDLGWGDHYIWRLFSAVVVTALAGFLAGAIARENGGKVAAVANIPSVLVWAVTAYVMAFSRTEWTGQTGFMVVSLIAIPLTTWIAYQAGRIGAEVQTSEFDESTVLGIRPSHWVWIVFVVYPYVLGVVFVIVKFFALQFSTWRETSIVGSIVALLALVPVIFVRGNSDKQNALRESFGQYRNPSWRLVPRARNSDRLLVGSAEASSPDILSRKVSANEALPTTMDPLRS